MPNLPMSRCAHQRWIGQKCSAVESIPGKRSGPWAFRGTRTPAAGVFENIQDLTVAELAEEFAETREQIETVRQFAALSAETPVSRS